METFKFTPKKFTEHEQDPAFPEDPDKTVAKEVESEFEGHVLAEIPSYSKRLKITRETNYVEGPDGKLVSVNWADRAIKIAELGELHAREVALTHKVTGAKVTTVEQLGAYPQGGKILQEVGLTAMNGVTLGETWSPSSSSSASGSAAGTAG